jgi:hypothetical protein
MKKYIYLLIIFFWIILFFNQSEISYTQYLLTLLEVNNDTIGFPSASVLTNKKDSTIYYIPFNNSYMGNENLKNTELQVRIHDTLNTKGKFPAVTIQFALIKGNNTLVLMNPDCTGYWKTLVDSLKIYNKWVHITLKDSAQGIFEGLAIKIFNRDTTRIDSNRYFKVDQKLNTR